MKTTVSVVLFVLAALLAVVAALSAYLWFSDLEVDYINLGYWRRGPASERTGPLVSMWAVSLSAFVLAVFALVMATRVRRSTKMGHATER